MITIWLNHWFSTAYNIVQLIRESNPDARIICSNAADESPIKAVCDEWVLEPVLQPQEYVDHCLEFCDRNKVNVFVPRRHLVAISEQKNRFEQAGVHVMVDDFASVSVLNDKVEAYKAFQNRKIGVVPEYRLATTADQFISAYEDLSSVYRSVCFKFVRDEGGKSFRRIDDSARGYTTLFKKKTTRITLNDAVEFLSERESFAPLMLMPYLPNEEISVDCLYVAGRLLAIPRVKSESRVEVVKYDPDIIDVCRVLVESFGLKQPCNIQFKYMDGVPYLLEVNTRMSGGDPHDVPSLRCQHSRFSNK